MKSFRKEIIQQIEKIPEGRIFTTKDLMFDIAKTANVNVLLAELVKKGQVKRIEKGVFYKAKESSLGLGPLPVREEELANFLQKKINGYLSGYYIYNLMGITEQVPTIITIATPKPVRPFRFDNMRFNCIKSYKDDVRPEEVKYLRVLDAIRDMKHIPGRTSQQVYQTLKNRFFANYADEDVQIIAELAMKYPPRVRAITASLLEEVNCIKPYLAIRNTIKPITFTKYSNHS